MSVRKRCQKSRVGCGNLERISYLEYVRRSLLPTLMPFNGFNPKSVVIMDNSSIHHVDEVVSTIESIGAIVNSYHHTALI